jgi:integrase/recombinase XerD
MSDIDTHAQKLADVLAAAGRSRQTIKHYTLTLRCFSRSIAPRALDDVTADDLDLYQCHLAARGLSDSTMNIAICALRFHYRDVLGHHDWNYNRIPTRRRHRSLPEVMSQDEVRALLAATDELRYRAAFELGYGCGLRVSEMLALEPRHIDAARGVIRIENGKGEKDRDVPLPASLLATLRECWRRYRPQTFLLEGLVPGKALSARSVQHAFAEVRRRAGIAKNVTPHSLRHAFATHLVERGTGLQVVQRLLGHRHLSTTAIYLHLAKTWLAQVKSPLESLDEEK